MTTDERREELESIQSKMTELGIERLVVRYDGEDDNGWIECVDGYRPGDLPPEAYLDPGDDAVEPDWSGSGNDETAEPADGDPKTLDEGLRAPAARLAWRILLDERKHWMDDAGASGAMHIRVDDTRIEVDHVVKERRTRPNGFTVDCEPAA